jgi:hypothetical protein
MRDPQSTAAAGLRLLVAACCFGLGSAEAKSYKYTYTSLNYGEVEGVPPFCLTAAMHFSITLVLSARLPPNAAQLAITPLSWTANNGLHTFNSKMKTAALAYSVFWTDGKGNITDWTVGASKGPHQEYVESDSEHTEDDVGYQTCAAAGAYTAGIAFPYGTWTRP